MMVSPSDSPSSLNSSTYLTDRQCAMWRISPSPKKPLSMPLQANRPTWPLCNGVTGRLVIFCCLRTRMPRAFCIATDGGREACGFRVLGHKVESVELGERPRRAPCKATLLGSMGCGDSGREACGFRVKGPDTEGVGPGQRGR